MSSGSALDPGSPGAGAKLGGLIFRFILGSDSGPCSSRPAASVSPFAEGTGRPACCAHCLSWGKGSHPRLASGPLCASDVLRCLDKAQSLSLPRFPHLSHQAHLLCNALSLPQPWARTKGDTRGKCRCVTEARARDPHGPVATPPPSAEHQLLAMLGGGREKAHDSAREKGVRGVGVCAGEGNDSPRPPRVPAHEY